MTRPPRRVNFTTWAASLPPGLRRDTDGLEDVRLGAGMAVPLSERAQLRREPDSADFRAGFSIRLD